MGQRTKTTGDENTMKAAAARVVSTKRSGNRSAADWTASTAGDRLLSSAAAQRKGPLDDEEPVQGRFPAQRQSPEEEEPLQGKTAAPVQREPNAKSGIPHEVQANMESVMNADFSDVQVHPNSSKAPEVGALAYTQGNDIHFAPGQFRPDTSAGKQLLGHELAHVVQQRQGKVHPTTEVSGMPVNDDPALENEADVLGQKGS